MDGRNVAFRYFEDFAVGDVIDLGSYPVSAAEIVEFAGEFDPAPFHLSEEGGRNSMLGRLSASGWHTCAMAMRMMCDAFLLNSSGQGAPGIDEARWLAPVRPGDTLAGRATVLSARRSATRAGIGLVRFRFEFHTAPQTPVLTLLNAIMFSARATAADSATGDTGR